MCSPSWRFFKRARWAFHGRATPDFEPGRGLSAHYQPGMLNVLVNHRSGCSHLLSRFLAVPRRDFSSSCARDRGMENRFELELRLANVSRRNVYTRICARSFVILQLDSVVIVYKSRQRISTYYLNVRTRERRLLHSTLRVPFGHGIRNAIFGYFTLCRIRIMYIYTL